MPDDTNCRCKCPRCTIRHTWPVVLVVLGIVSLASSLAPMDGHIETPVNTVPPIPPQGPLPGQSR